MSRFHIRIMQFSVRLAFAFLVFHGLLRKIGHRQAGRGALCYPVNPHLTQCH